MSGSVWSYANMWESVAAVQGDAPAIVQGNDVVSWNEFERQADAVAAHLLSEGLTQQAKVAVYMPNRPEFLVGYYAAFKAGLVPLNINYRYTSQELAYLLHNGDVEAVLFDAQYTSVIEEIRGEFPGMKTWVAAPADGHDDPAWATAWQDVASQTPANRPVTADWGRRNEDLLMIYTGGTTGMPKGVMWQLGDMIARGNFGANPLLGTPPLEAPEQAGPRSLEVPVQSRSIIPPPLMHGTGMLSAFGALTAGGMVILLPPGKFSAESLLDTAERHRATRMTIVGEPFARPILDALDAHPGRWDLTDLKVIGSSGAMWTRETKMGLVRHIPGVSLIDSYASSEALGMGTSTTTAHSETKTARFELTPTCAVFTEDHRRVEPGSGEKGLLAVGGHNPIGYYKDEEKTAKTFPIIDGERWCMPGDWAIVNADGSLEILGRGSQCINTGGEKVFPEEVEEALRRHEAVRDVAVTGLPDRTWGERIAAVVELQEGRDNPGDEVLAGWVREQLADYKVPRNFVYVDSVGRAPNGKLDYKAIKQIALDAEGSRAA